MRNHIKTVIFSILPLLVLVGGVELIARIFSNHIPMGYEAIWMNNLYDEKSFFKTKTIDGKEYVYSDMYPVTYYWSEYNNTSLDGKYLLKEKGNGLRIFSFGGSSTAGSPFGHWGSFTRFLSQELKKIRKSEDVVVETLNFGTSGAAISRARFLLDKALWLKPDVIVIYAGHNEICDSGAVEPLSDGARSARINNFVFAHSYAYRYLTASFGRYFAPKPPLGDAPFNVHQCVRPPIAYDLDAMKQRYQNYLNEIAKMAQDKGIKVVVVSQIANMFVVPSDVGKTEIGKSVKSQDNADDKEISAERNILVSKDAARLGVLYKEEKFDETEALALQMLALDQANPVAHYYIGLLDVRKGDTEKAAKELKAAQENDRMPYRYRPSYTDVLKGLEKKYKNVSFVDAEKNIRTLVSDGLYDGRIIMDTMHPTIELNKYLANEIIEQFFIKNDYMADKFDYAKFRGDSVFRGFDDASKYGLICQRFYNTKDWKECLDKAVLEYNTYAKSPNIERGRRASRAWESLYYYGLATKNQDKIRESRAIAKMKSNGPQD